jgi:DNA-binding MarR family transcriptional regulator
MIDHLLQGCLFFTANSLARVLTSMAEDAFKTTGLAPHYAFIVMLVCEKPGLSQKEISEYLQLTPSTITRFVDKLEGKGLVKRAVEGKTVLLSPTADGQQALPEIEAAWKRLYDRYSKVLGYKEGDDLTARAWQATLQLEGKK